METAAMLREARVTAGLSQQEIASRCNTSQPAIAAYESGSRTPTIATLKRLLRACNYDMEIVASAQLRRGAASLRELARAIAEDLRNSEYQGALRLLFGFADDFRGSPRPGKFALIRDEPASTGDARFDAALGGVAEFFAAEAGISAPPWVNHTSRFVEPWWFVASRPAFHAYTLANSPALFVRHGVFIAREVFDRV